MIETIQARNITVGCLLILDGLFHLVEAIDKTFPAEIKVKLSGYWLWRWFPPQTELLVVYPQKEIESC